MKKGSKQAGGETVYWDEFHYGDWRMIVASTDRGLCYVGTPGDSYDVFSAYAASRFPAGQLRRGEERLTELKQGLSAYLSGASASWSCPLDLQGTAFQQLVWDALMAVPSGETVSYSDIAARIGKPEAVRAVASAIGANPALIAVPCHRIIGKNGALTGYRGGLPMKERLLQLESRSAANEAPALAAGAPVSR